MYIYTYIYIYIYIYVYWAGGFQVTRVLGGTRAATTLRKVFGLSNLIDFLKPCIFDVFKIL